MSDAARAAYSALMALAAPAVVARWLWRSRREPLYRAHLTERFGFASSAKPEARGASLWLHAVSLGETRAAAALIDELRRQRPGLRLLLTHGTATGRAAGEKLLHPGDEQAWLPYDTPGAVARFFAAHRPALGVLMETEIWPNLLAGAARAGVPVLLANARLSERSLRKGERLAALMRPAAAHLTAALAQTDDDARRLREAGVAEVAVLGNLKYDMTPAPALLAAGRVWHAALAAPPAHAALAAPPAHAAPATPPSAHATRAGPPALAPRPVVMFAASREGEEAPLLAAWVQSLGASAAAGTTGATSTPRGARPLLLLVPRHPQRFDEVAALVAAQTTPAGRALTLARRSDWSTSGAALPVQPPPEALDADVWLGDSLGEMPLYYATADLALLGGSYAPLGGQNLIEAASCGCPLLIGPHTFNFAEAAELALAAGAAERVADLPAAVERALAWLADPAALAERAERAATFAASHRGAAARMAAAVLAHWPPSTPSTAPLRESHGA